MGNRQKSLLGPGLRVRHVGSGPGHCVASRGGVLLAPVAGTRRARRVIPGHRERHRRGESVRLNSASKRGATDGPSSRWVGRWQGR